MLFILPAHMSTYPLQHLGNRAVFLLTRILQPATACSFYHIDPLRRHVQYVVLSLRYVFVFRLRYPSNF